MAALLGQAALHSVSDGRQRRVPIFASASRRHSRGKLYGPTNMRLEDVCQCASWLFGVAFNRHRRSWFFSSFWLSNVFPCTLSGVYSALFLRLKRVVGTDRGRGMQHRRGCPIDMAFSAACFFESFMLNGLVPDVNIPSTSLASSKRIPSDIAKRTLVR